MDFPIAELMDEDACYAKLLQALHPAGLACPRCHTADRIAVHRSHRAPGARLPLQGLPAGLQRLHRLGTPGLAPPPLAADPHPPRHRPGRPHRPARPASSTATAHAGSPTAWVTSRAWTPATQARASIVGINRCPAWMPGTDIVVS